MTDSRERRASDPLVQPDARPRSPAPEEIESLRQSLRSLPDIEPDPELWERIQARAATRGGRMKGRLNGRLPFAMAASLLLAATAGILGVNLLRSGPADPAPQFSDVAMGPAGESEAIRALMERSRKLEPLTRNFEADPAASAFQYRIADVDSQLFSLTDGRLSQAETQRLWGQRVALMESLAEVRRARAALQPAVY